MQLSYGALERKIAEDAYHNQGNMPNNFGMTIPDYKRAFQAIQMFKDEYLLDYINVEQLGERDEDIDERVIENEIVHNVKNFIMTFGRGFSYMGNKFIMTNLVTTIGWICSSSIEFSNRLSSLN